MSLLDLSNAVGFTKPPRGGKLWFGGSDVAVRKVDEIVSPTTYGNSTSETVLGSMTIPPLSLSNQGGARGYFAGTIRDDTLPTETVRLRTKLVIGGSTVTIAETSAIGLSNSTAPRVWHVESLIMGTTLSTQLLCSGYADITEPSTYITHVNAYTGTSENTVLVPNSTGSATLKVTMQFSTAAADVGGSVQLGYLETLA